MQAGVYSMRMARVNVYLPDELAAAARKAHVNISTLTQAALREELASRNTNAWLDSLKALPRRTISHDRVLRALDEARDDLEGGRS